MTWTRIAIFATCLLLLEGCVTTPESNNPNAENPGIPAASQPKEIGSFRVSDPEPAPVVDKELENVPPEMQSKVELWIAYFQGKGRVHMERYLARSTRYIQLMKRIMKENGLPEDLVYVALIESGFSSRATSRAAAVGYWQFIKGTGRRYGLEINSFVDERRDPVLSTQAAAEYFKGLYSAFGSWYLAMASYNVGENRVKREVMAGYSRDFWDLARKRRLPKETANYIPKFIAARLIGRNPEKYGFSDIDYDKPEEFELVKLTKPVNLKKMAEKMNLDYEEFKIMNPKFRGEIAPVKGDKALELRVPVGQVQLALNAAQESTVEKVEFVADAGETETYKVHSGDSLFTIAKKYHTTVSWLRDVNDLKAGRKLKVGMRIQVPDRSSPHSSTKVAKVKAEKPAKVAPVVAARAPEDAESAAANTEIVTAKGVYYLVQSGDTLSSIADQYDSTISELRKMNKMGKGSLIKVGMKLRVPKDEGLPTDLEAGIDKTTSEILKEPTTTHTVKAGENLSTIAKHYGVSVKDIRDANKLKKKSKIIEGMSLLIPVKPKTGTSVNSRVKSKSHRWVKRGAVSHRQVASARTNHHHRVLKTAKRERTTVSEL